MKTNLISMNSINTKNDISNIKSKQKNSKDFESSIDKESKKTSKEDKKDEIDKEKINKEDEIDKEHKVIEDENGNKEKNYENHNENEAYMYILQKLNMYKEINNISKLKYKENNIFNNIEFQNTNIEQMLNENKIETLDIQYINDIEEDSLFKDLYDISYKSSSKESFNLNNLYEFDDRVESNNEVDVLGKISMTEQTTLFDKNNFIKNEEKDLQSLFKTDIENKLNDETIKNIKLMKNEDIKELSIKLRPRELGDMHIKLLQENDTLKAIITVTDKDVYNLINKNISDLKQHLESFNVKEIAIVVDSDNNYSSDSFDKNFEEHRHKNEHESNKKSKNKNNIHITKESDDIYKNDDGLNLLA